jgi:quinohemoprotein ethanol dehydrogenase
LSGGDAAAASGVTNNAGRLLALKLGGSATLPAEQAEALELAAIPAELDPAQVKQGLRLYNHWCQFCHGPAVVSGGVIKDIRTSAPEIYDALPDIVIRGALRGKGMPRFGDWLGEDDVQAIRAYLLSRRAALVAEAR